MMKYVRLNGDIVEDILYDNDPSFPGFPVAKRIPRSLLAEYIAVDDSVTVSTGWRRTEDGTFEEVVEEEEAVEEEVTDGV